MISSFSAPIIKKEELIIFVTELAAPCNASQSGSIRQEKNPRPTTTGLAPIRGKSHAVSITLRPTLTIHFFSFSSFSLWHAHAHMHTDVCNLSTCRFILSVGTSLFKNVPAGKRKTRGVGSNHAAAPLNLFLLKVASFEQHKTGEEGRETPWTKSIAGNSHTRTHPTPTEPSQSQADLIALRTSREHTLAIALVSFLLCV